MSDVPPRQPWLDERPSQLERHPRDGWTPPSPWPMGPALQHAVRGVTVAMLPYGAAGAPLDASTIAEVEAGIGVTLRCMQPLMALGLRLLLRLLAWAPLWAWPLQPRLGGFRRLHAGADAAAAMRDADLLMALGESRIGPLRAMITAGRAAVLTAYYDLPQVQLAIGHDPLPHLRGRIALRQRLLAGAPATAADVLHPDAATVAAWSGR